MLVERLNLLTQALKQNKIASQIISDPYAIYYFLGYQTEPGERLFLFNWTAEGKGYLYLNRLFPKAQLSPEIADLITVIYYNDGEPILETIAEHLPEGATGIDKFWPAHFLLTLMQLKPTLDPQNNSALVDDIRGIKSPQEQAIMRESSVLNDQAMEKMIDLIQYGLPEEVMTTKLNEIYRELGVDGFSFNPIVAYGPNGADPHHANDQSIPDYGDTVIIDMGGIYKNYASDMTRTVFYGQPSDHALEVYDIVRRANRAGREMVRPGVTFRDIDLATRKVIEDAGYGKFYTHRTGHFIGLECHEAGDVSQFNEAVVQVGQVFSIEPGIYLPGQLGVRIEDLVIVTEDGCEVLNHVTREPIIVEPNHTDPIG